MRQSRDINTQKGLITLDFLFAFCLVWGFFIVFFSLSLTLSVASILQYATFASARAFAGAHTTPQDQVRLARLKFDQVISSSALSRLFGGNWFVVKPEELQVGDMTQFDPPLIPDEPEQNQFIGVRIPLSAKVLDIQIPLYGSTTGGGEDGGFRTLVGSYLLREPTAVECRAFMELRWKAMASVGNGIYAPAMTSNLTPLFEDNGC